MPAGGAFSASSSSHRPKRARAKSGAAGATSMSDIWSAIWAGTSAASCRAPRMVSALRPSMLAASQMKSRLWG